MTPEMKIVNSKLGHFTEGLTFEVQDTQTSQYSDRVVMNITFDHDPQDMGGHVGHTQLYRMPDHPPNQWVEICVGRESDTLTLQGDL